MSSSGSPNPCELVNLPFLARVGLKSWRTKIADSGKTPDGKIYLGGNTALSTLPADSLVLLRFSFSSMNHFDAPTLRPPGRGANGSRLMRPPPPPLLLLAAPCCTELCEEELEEEALGGAAAAAPEAVAAEEAGGGGCSGRGSEGPAAAAAGRLMAGPRVGAVAPEAVAMARIRGRRARGEGGAEGGGELLLLLLPLLAALELQQVLECGAE